MQWMRFISGSNAIVTLYRLRAKARKLCRFPEGHCQQTVDVPWSWVNRTNVTNFYDRETDVDQTPNLLPFCLFLFRPISVFACGVSPNKIRQDKNRKICVVIGDWRFAGQFRSHAISFP